MKSSLVLSIVTALFMGCNDTHSGQRTDPQPQPPSPWVIGLVPTSLFPGSTNVGVAPKLSLSVRRDYPAADPAMVAQELGKASFVAANGEVIGAAPIVPRDDAGDYLFEVVPEAPLLMDMWYDVIYPSIPVALPSGTEVQVKIVADSAYDLGQSVVTRFYTGSAPQLRRVWAMGGLDGGVGISKSLYVSFSEAVSVEDILSGGLVVSASAPMSGQCLIGGRNCAEYLPTPGMPDSGIAPIIVLDSGIVLPPPIAGSGAEIMFQYQFDVEVPIHFELALALSLRGSTRTLEEALEAGAVRRTATVSNGFLRYSMDESSWRQRSPGSHEFGWSNVE